MKRSFVSRYSLPLAACAALLTGVPALRAQAPSPSPTASPAAAAPGSDDIFDVIKKGADKLQKEAKAQKDLGPQLKQLSDRQNELLKRHVEMERHVQAILLKQQEAIEHLEKTVDQLQKECAECKAQASPAPEAGKPAGTLPMTEPAVKATPAPSPASTPATPAPTATPAT